MCVLTALQQTKNKGNAQREICTLYMNVHMYLCTHICMHFMHVVYIYTYKHTYKCTIVRTYMSFLSPHSVFSANALFQQPSGVEGERLRTKTRLGPSRKERQRERVSLRAGERHKERGRVAGWCTHFARVQCVIITQHTHVSCCCCGCVDPHFPFKHLSSVSLCCFVSFGKQKAHAKHAHA